MCTFSYTSFGFSLIQQTASVHTSSSTNTVKQARDITDEQPSKKWADDELRRIDNVAELLLQLLLRLQEHATVTLKEMGMFTWTPLRLYVSLSVSVGLRHLNKAVKTINHLLLNCSVHKQPWYSPSCTASFLLRCISAGGSFSCMLVGSHTLALQNKEMTNDGAH